MCKKKYSKSEISPICGYGGGVVSQEIIKFIGLYKPINQWFRAEFFGILDKTINHEEKTEILNTQKNTISSKEDSNIEEENISSVIVGENNENMKINKNEDISDNKYNYDKYSFEKISVIIKKSKIYVKIYKYLKTLNINDELKNNIILLSDLEQTKINIPKKRIFTNENIMNNRDNFKYKTSFLNKKTKRKKSD